MFKFIVRILCALSFGAGLYFIIHSLMRIKYASQHKGLGDAVSDYFEHNPQWNGLIEFFGGTKETLPPYDSSIFIMISVGIVLVVFSAIIFTLTFRRK